ncbi:hypothetical protein BGZ73_002264 [Actinomortierella ambigua]|nr:hypothetical protein BGZ73_002264 [Actinomortierella ambigua]
MSSPINFYRQHDDYGQLSNFFPSPFELKDRIWPTAEHYFQAEKFAHLDDQTYVDKVHQAPTPGEAARLGRKRSWPLRSDWEEVKEKIMGECVLQKFLQNPDLWAILDSTGDRKLVEHTKNDAYWGDGGDGHGLNRLGVILMQSRTKIREEKAKDVAESL